MKTKIITLTLFLLMNLPVHAQDQSDEDRLSSLTTQYWAFSSQQKWTESVIAAEQAYQLAQKLYDANDIRLGPIASNLGNALTVRKDVSARPPLEAALKIFEKNDGSDSAKLIPVLMNLATVHILADRIDDAEALVSRAIKIASSEYGRKSSIIAELSSRAGRELADVGEHRLAYKFLRDAHGISLDFYGEKSQKTQQAAFNAAESARETGNLHAQVSFLRKLAESFEQPSHAKSDFERDVHIKLVNAYHALGKSKRATPHVLALANSHGSLDEPLLIAKPDVSSFSKEFNTQLKGSVTIRFDVDDNGNVRNTNVVNLNGQQKLAKLAVKTLDNYRYVPAIQNGVTKRSNGLEATIMFNEESETIQSASN